MPRIRDENEVGWADQIAEGLDQEMTAQEEADAFKMVAAARDVGDRDLNDGGRVGGATLRPMSGGKRLAQGRAVARRAWMWDGTETLLTLAWNPEGTLDDGARHYMLKRHCLCCGASGFTRTCPACVSSNCQHCHGGTVPEKIIPNFYLRQSQVPYPQKFFGDIPCFLPLCPRQGSKGFKTEEDMRMHARTRHRMEYQAHIETIQANRADEVDQLRARLDRMMGINLPAPQLPVPEKPEKQKRNFSPEWRAAQAERIKAVRAAKKPRQGQSNHPIEST